MNNIDIVSLKRETEDILHQSLPSHCIIGNPLDLTGDTNAERYYRVLKTIKSAYYIDIILLIFGDPIPDAANYVKKMKEEMAQEIIACYLGAGDIQTREVINLHRIGIPTFPTPERAMKAIAALIQYGCFQKYISRSEV